MLFLVFCCFFPWFSPWIPRFCMRFSLDSLVFHGSSRVFSPFPVVFPGLRPVSLAFPPRGTPTTGAQGALMVASQPSGTVCGRIASKPWEPRIDGSMDRWLGFFRENPWEISMDIYGILIHFYGISMGNWFISMGYLWDFDSCLWDIYGNLIHFYGISMGFWFISMRYLWDFDSFLWDIYIPYESW